MFWDELLQRTPSLSPDQKLGGLQCLPYSPVLVTQAGLSCQQKGEQEDGALRDSRVPPGGESFDVLPSALLSTLVESQILSQPNLGLHGSKFILKHLLRPTVNQDSGKEV